MLSSSPSLMAVIFDCDGVLVDTEPLHYQAFQEVLRPLGLGYDYDRYLEHYIGYDDRDAIVEAFREAGREIMQADLERLMEAKAMALMDISSRGFSTFPGVLELVRELARRDIPLAVASGALRREVEIFTEALGIREAFRVIVGADDVSRSKPDPETYLLAVERLREALGRSELSTRTCIAIEDTPAGILAARGAGIYVIGVAHSYPVTGLTDADKVVERLTELDVPGLLQLV